jgi:hypothetical protein
VLVDEEGEGRELLLPFNPPRALRVESVVKGSSIMSERVRAKTTEKESS